MVGKNGNESTMRKTESVRWTSSPENLLPLQPPFSKALSLSLPSNHAIRKHGREYRTTSRITRFTTLHHATPIPVKFGKLLKTSSVKMTSEL
jgi:hypothetical protein